MLDFKPLQMQQVLPRHFLFDTDGVLRLFQNRFVIDDDWTTAIIRALELFAHRLRLAMVTSSFAFVALASVQRSLSAPG